jgi:hypothetical protein
MARVVMVEGEEKTEPKRNGEAWKSAIKKLNSV